MDVTPAPAPAPRPRRRKPKMEYRIQFRDECPSIGAGSRGIAVLKLGRKWVHIVDPSSGAKARLTVALWRSLPKRVVRKGKLTDEVVY